MRTLYILRTALNELTMKYISFSITSFCSGVFEADDFHWMSVFLNQSSKTLLYSSSSACILFFCFFVYFSIQILTALNINNISSLICIMYIKNIFKTSFLMSKKYRFSLNVADSEAIIFSYIFLKNVFAFN